MPVAAAVARDVDRGGREARRLERLVHRLGPPPEMTRVEVDDRVAEPLREAGRAHRRKGRSILDEALLLPVPPDEVRNLVDVAVRTCRDRRETDRSEGRERRDGAAV